MARILIVDDEAPIRKLLCKILGEAGYSTAAAAGAAEARDLMSKETFDLILCDLTMPGESGVEFLGWALETYPDTAAVMVTGTDDPGTAEYVIKSGVYDYVTKPIEANRILTSVFNAIRRRDLEISHRTHESGLKRLVDERTHKLQKALDGIIHSMAITVETRDPYTAGHQRRVAELASAIAKELGLPEERIAGIHTGAMIHDLGKLAVPAEILAKPSRLTENEFNLIKEHPHVGYSILRNIEFPWPVADMVYQHHERMDGSGYPLGLAGDDILPEARILAIADVVEAMAFHRPYRPALGVEVALEEISKNSGRVYDRDASQACLRLFENGGVWAEEGR